MIYKLPTPVLGQTHAILDTIEMRPSNLAIAARYGTVGKDGEFIPEPLMYTVHRNINGAELEAFLSLPVERGLPADKLGNYRTEDLFHWFDTYGLANSSYVPPKEEEAPGEEVKEV